jgi:hypothetical protein
MPDNEEPVGDDALTIDEVELFSDGDGIAVIGETSAVERFIRGLGERVISRDLNLDQIRPFMMVASEVMQAASDAAANSGRWLKLTEESAEAIQEHGLMDTKVPGVKHVMIGKPGDIGRWLQAEDGVGSVVANPDSLAGIAGVMAQVASQQAAAEMKAYLTQIGEKVDDILRRQDDAVVAQMIGAGLVIEEAMTVREASGKVNEVTWGKVEGTSETIAATQAFALRQLESIAEQLEGASKLGELADRTESAIATTRQWLAVLARCSQLQALLDVLELDRVLASSPDELNQHRLGLRNARHDRVAVIEQHTERLLDRISIACDTANSQLPWNLTNATNVLYSGNAVAADVHRFEELIGVQSELLEWDERQIGFASRVGAVALQKTRDAAPVAAKIAGAVVPVVGAIGVKVIKEKLDPHGPRAD